MRIFIPPSSKFRDSLFPSTVGWLVHFIQLSPYRSYTKIVTSRPLNFKTVALFATVKRSGKRRLCVCVRERGFIPDGEEIPVGIGTTRRPINFTRSARPFAPVKKERMGGGRSRKIPRRNRYLSYDVPPFRALLLMACWFYEQSADIDFGEILLRDSGVSANKSSLVVFAVLDSIFN